MANFLDDVETVHLDEFTISPEFKDEHGKIEINVDLNGSPFAQLWTWRKSRETHPWHAKTLNGDYSHFYGIGGKQRAIDFVRSKA